MPRMKVVRLDQVPPGERFHAQLGGIDVLVFNLDGELYATGLYCPHEEIELDRATCEGKIITCWEHGYEMRIDTGECLTDPSLTLPTFPVTVVNGEIYVDL